MRWENEGLMRALLLSFLDWLFRSSPVGPDDL
jgi:hypothetical protein